MNRYAGVGALVVCILAVAVNGQQPPGQTWNAECVMTYSAQMRPDDAVSGDLDFTPDWVFRIANTPGGTLSNPRIAVTTAPLFGALRPFAWPGSIVTEDPEASAYVWTATSGSLPDGQWLQADLTGSPQQVRYPLGYALTRGMQDPGRPVGARAIEQRAFNLTLALTEAARDFAGDVSVPLGTPGLPIAVSGFETCVGTPGTQWSVFMDGSRYGIRWSALNDALFPAPQVFALNCTLTLTNNTDLPAVFSPEVGMKVGQWLFSVQSPDGLSVVLPLNSATPPPDPLEGSVRFEAAGAPDPQAIPSAAKRFYRQARLALVNRTQNTPPPAPPVLNRQPDAFLAEGGSLNNRPGTFDDAWADGPWTATVDYGDGTGVQPLAFTLGAPESHPVATFTLNHKYVDDGVYSVTVVVTDRQGIFGTSVFAVTVTNVAPTVNLGTPKTVALTEGGTLVRTAMIGDGGTNDAWTATVDFGDGTAPAPMTLTPVQGPVPWVARFSLSHVYARSGTYTLTATVTDKDGATGTDQLTVTVTGLPPKPNNQPPASIPEGGSINRPGNFDDAWADGPWTATVDYGDGTGVQPLAFTLGAPESHPVATFTLSHQYLDNGVYTVTVTVADRLGAAGTSLFTVTVTNVAPSIDLGLPNAVALSEGATLARTGTIGDSGPQDAWTVTVDYGDGTPVESLSLTPTPGPGTQVARFALSHRYVQNGAYTLAATVTDKDGATGTTGIAVTVNNAPPVIVSLTGPTGSVTVGSAATVGVTFSDAGTLDLHTVTIAWGDGLITTSGPLAATVTTFSASHAYSAAGRYTVAVTVADKDGGTAQGTLGSLTIVSVWESWWYSFWYWLYSWIWRRW